MNKKIKQRIVEKTDINTPNLLIKYINNLEGGKYRDYCFYHKRHKCLVSRDPDYVDFYYDYLHGVIIITEYEI